MARVKDTDYAYSVSRIHAIERSLLDRGKIMQIAEAKTASDALRMIYDAGYVQAEDYEQSFESELQKTYDLIYSMAPDKSLFDVFLIENDYYNLKVLLKAEFLDKDLDYLLNKRARTSLEAVKEAVRERKAEKVSEQFATALDEALASFSKEKNAQAVDMIIDRACYSEMSEFANATGNKFIIGLIKIKIDLTNITTMLRIRKMGKMASFAKSAMLGGGSLDVNMLAGCVDEPKEAILQKFASGRYSNLVSQALSDSDAADFEVACGDYIIEYMRAAKRVTFGAEPLVAYIFAKENEIKQLRIIMVGKTNNLDSELIKRRLNIAYV